MLKHIVIVAGVLAVFAFLARETAWYGPYVYDEADYMYAVGLGFPANWIDSPTTSLTVLVRQGLQRPRDADRRLELSESIRGSNDILFYRHWHGPVYVAWLDFTHHLVSGERRMRAWTDVFPALTAILMYAGVLWLLPGAAGQIAAILAAVLYVWGYPVVRTTELCPHPVFVLFVTAALLCLAKMFQQPRSPRTYWYAATVFTGLAFCTLEVAFALVFTVLACAYFDRRQLKPDVAFAAKSTGVFLLTVLVVWPAAIFKLSVVKSYLFMAYLAVFRHGAWGHDIGIGETWRLRVIESPIPWILFVIAAVYFARRSSKTPWLIPVWVFAVLMFLAILRVNSELPRYVLPILPAIVLLGALGMGMMLEGRSRVVQAGATLLICAAMFFTSWPNIRSHMPKPAERAEAMLALVAGVAPAHPTLLVPHEDLPMLHCYFPAVRFKSYSDEEEIDAQRRSGLVDGFISRGDPPQLVRASKAQP